MTRRQVLKLIAAAGTVRRTRVSTHPGFRAPRVAGAAKTPQHTVNHTYVAAVDGRIGMSKLGFCLLVLLVALAACIHYDHDTPDTSANLAGFERHFGFEPPADVTDVYYYADELGVDVTYQLGFEAGPETVARIVAELDLTQADTPGGFGLGVARDFPWWDMEDIKQATLYQKTNTQRDYWRELWYSAATGRVCYLEYSL